MPSGTVDECTPRYLDHLFANAQLEPIPAPIGPFHHEGEGEPNALSDKRQAFQRAKQDGGEMEITRGQILSQGPKVLSANDKQVVIEDDCLWKQPKQDAVMADHRRITITAVSPSQYFIDFEITLEPLVDIRIEKTNHSLFSARMVPELSVESGGVLVNAAGDSAEDGTFGVASPWCDYTGTLDGVKEGLAIFQHPENPWYPAKWFTRNYGFFSPTPMYWPEGDHTAMAKGEKAMLKYRVVVHSGDVSAEAIEVLFKEYGEN